MYPDDILIATRASVERHWRELRKVLKVINENNAAVKWSTCKVLTKEIEWLGFNLSNTGTEPVEKNWNRLKTRSDLKKFQT